jgi:hypothetical protein
VLKPPRYYSIAFIIIRGAVQSVMCENEEPLVKRSVFRGRTE